MGRAEGSRRSHLTSGDHSYDDHPRCASQRSTSTWFSSPRSPRRSPGGGVSAGPPTARTTAVLRITTEDGAVGEAYHEWSGPMLADIVDRVLREELVGERADRREWLWHRLWELDRTEEFPIWLFGVVDVALWDLEGRVLGVPVHRLLGTYRDSIPAYASTTTFSTVEEYLDVADQCLELGYPAIKLHAWGDARADAELCQRASRPRRARRRPDVRRLGRLRPAGRGLPRSRALGGEVPLVRGADARVQRDGVSLAGRACRGAAARRARPPTEAISTRPTSSPRGARRTSGRARTTAAA